MTFAAQGRRVRSERAVVAAVATQSGDGDEHLRRVRERRGGAIPDPGCDRTQGLEVRPVADSSCPPRSRRGRLHVQHAREPDVESRAKPKPRCGTGGTVGCGSRCWRAAGGARFLQGLQAAFPDDEITVIGNTADDIWLHGLKVCPDLDTVMYTLGGGIDLERGWGRSDETYGVLDELGAYGFDPLWFTLGDRDIATHLVRTQLLAAGYPLHEVTAALCARWQPGVTLPAHDERPCRDPRNWWTPRRAGPPFTSSNGG